MEYLSSEPEIKHIVEIYWADRWLVYQRLQELAIPCSCATNQPLTVEIAHATAAVQLWSVIRQVTARRQDLIAALERSWNQRLS